MKVQPPPKEDKVPSPEVTVEQPIVLVTVQPEPVLREEQPPKKEILRRALDKPKVANPDIKLQVGNDKKGKLKPKRASPAFKFSSGIQQEVDQDELLRKILESPVQLTLQEILSSYKMSKCMNSATKMQKIPMDKGIKPKAKPKRSLEDVKRLIKSNARVSSAKVEEITDEDSEILSKSNNDAESSGINQSQTIYIQSVQFDSDDDSEDDSEDESDSTEDQADSYYQKLLQDEFEFENEWDVFIMTNLTQHRLDF